jgi:hypothetical protein
MLHISGLTVPDNSKNARATENFLEVRVCFKKVQFQGVRSMGYEAYRVYDEYHIDKDNTGIGLFYTNPR